jgi:hypothetical protein
MLFAALSRLASDLFLSGLQSEFFSNARKIGLPSGLRLQLIE